MLRKTAFFAASAFLFNISVAAESTTPTPEEHAKLVNEAFSIVQKFSGTLKPQLKQAIKTKDAAYAVEICSKMASQIAENLSQESGWDISRVSLKPRSPNAKPDAWEEKALIGFDDLVAQGKKPEYIGFAEIVDGKFRFMKAQGTEQVCMNCHGKTVKSKVEKALKEHYPEDQARGYIVGQVRGAFSLSKDLK